MYKINIVVLLVLLLLQTTHTVKITRLHVPGTVIMEKCCNDSTPIYLDCNYDVNPKEKGFVLKWYFNETLIYQWIPDRPPQVFSYFKNLISFNEQVPARSLMLRNIPKNISGEYKCSVQTFESIDDKAGYLQIVVPEQSFELEQISNKEILLVQCSVTSIFPQPRIFLMLGTDYLMDLSRKILQNQDNTYNISILGKVHTKSIASKPIVVSCVMKVPNSSYVKRKESIYYEPYMNMLEDFYETFQTSNVSYNKENSNHIWSLMCFVGVSILQLIPRFF